MKHSGYIHQRGRGHGGSAPLPRSLPDRQHGVALFLGIVFLLIFTIVSVTFLRTTGLEERMAGNKNQVAMALFAAERGVSEALAEIGNGTISGPDPTTAEALTWSQSGSIVGTQKDYEANYTVTYLTHGEGAAEEVVLNDVGGAYFVVNSLGTSGTPGTSGPEKAKARRELEVALRVDITQSTSSSSCGNPPGIIGCDRVYIGSDSLTDSFSSSQWQTEGGSDPTFTGDGTVKTITEGTSILYIESSACVKGNLIGGNDIRVSNEPNCSHTVSGDVFADGDINWSKGDLGGIAKAEGNISGISGDANVSEDIVPLEQCDPLDVDQMFIDVWNDTFGALGPTSSSTTDFGTGDYYFSGSAPGTININGDVRFYVSGNMSGNNIHIYSGSLTVYLEGDFSMNSSGTNVTWDSGIPANFMLYSNARDPKGCVSDIDDGGATIENPNLFFGDNSVFFGDLYAPYASALFKDGSVTFGAVRAKCTQTLNQARFYLDTDLPGHCADTDSGEITSSYTFDVLYWNEIY